MSAPRRRLPSAWWAPTTLPFAAISASQPLITRNCRLYGWSVIESTGAAPAEIDLYDGGSNNGNLIAAIPLLTGVASQEWFGAPGLSIEGGVYAQMVSGSVRGAIWMLGLSDDEILAQYGYEYAQ